MLLTANTQELLVQLAAPHTTIVPDFYSVYVDKIKDAITPANFSGTFDNTPTVAVGSPANNTSRNITELQIYNGDSVSNTVIVSFFDGTNTRILKKSTLTAGQTLTYIRLEGWSVS